MHADAADDMVVLDLRELPVDAALAIDWAHEPRDAVSIVTVDVPGERVTAIDEALRAAGFQRAGRAWGEAGTLRTYRRAAGLRTWLRNAAAQLRVIAGELLVSARQTLPDHYKWSSWREQARALAGGDGVHVLDRDGGRPMAPLPRADVVRFVDSLPAQIERSWAMSLEPDEHVMAATIDRCFDRHGVWPISFSYPKPLLPIDEQPEQVLASIVPGVPYAYDDEDMYLAAYRRAHFGLTHRKAGWDCFRHLEILATGATPLMLDIEAVPSFSMVHYPKQLFASALEEARLGSAPDLVTRQALRAHVERHLTTVSMARYILNRAGLRNAERVLFVDERLPHAADYLSVLSLIGLKQLLGDRCAVMFPVDYIYDDTSIDTHALYGRGFGYTRVVGSDSRTSHERARTELDELTPGQFDAVVVGSIARNADLAQRLLGVVPPERTVWLHGEDTPPLLDETRILTGSGAHVFVRAIAP